MNNFTALIRALTVIATSVLPKQSEKAPRVRSLPLKRSGPRRLLAKQARPVPGLPAHLDLPALLATFALPFAVSTIPDAVRYRDSSCVSTRLTKQM